jgi:hypothetical protein
MLRWIGFKVEEVLAPGADVDAPVGFQVQHKLVARFPDRELTRATTLIPAQRVRTASNALRNRWTGPRGSRLQARPIVGSLKI